MKSSNNGTFSTSEFARLFGVKKDTLLYYDKIDLFKPAETHENGYRYYSLNQFDQFQAIQTFRKMDVSIKELKKYIESPSIAKLHKITMNSMESIE